MQQLEQFLRENRLRLKGKVAKGWSSYIYLAENARGKKFALKVLREKSNRRKMAERETDNLRFANSAGVGPKLVKTDFEKNIVLMEFIEGLHFSEWIYSKPPKKQLEKFLRALFIQAEKLDSLGLDHGQLQGRGKNILVTKKGVPVIIDFEKASTKRKSHNVKVLEAFLYRNPNSELVRKVKEIKEGIAVRQLSK